MEQLEITPAEDTIIAVSTPPGIGGIAVIRISGPKAITVADSAWKGKSLSSAKSHTAHLGKLISTDGSVLDEAVATVFRAPASFTGEDVVELSVHGSRWIQREVIADFVRRGIRVAKPGEFTKRAFLNGKLDLAQAEGIADLIASSSRAAHSLAISQTKGKFSGEFNDLRDKLIEFASLIELELDFSEEDVEFADRSNLLKLVNEIIAKLKRLSASFSTGAAIKDGVPVVIAGIPNAGKSSVLNILLSDDKAIVSDIPGTTRDTIEDTIEIEGILYRFIDTAGLRSTTDTVESLGIDRARQKMRQAQIVIWVFDPTSPLTPQLAEFNSFRTESPSTKTILLLNKSDLSVNPNLLNTTHLLNNHAHINDNVEGSVVEPSGETSPIASDAEPFGEMSPILFSANTGQGLDHLLSTLHDLALDGLNPDTDTIVTNARHYEAIIRGIDSLTRAANALSPTPHSTSSSHSPYETSQISADLIAQDIREAIHHLSSITGTISSATLLHSIFSRFCIGK